MTHDLASAQPLEPTLSIGGLARETGLTPALLRTWENRYGFPMAQRRASGHRRYAAEQVALVQGVVRRRDAGIRVELAIAEALSSATPSTPSVFAALRRRHPALNPYRLRKSTLLAVSWAIEDECCAFAERPVLFAAFQSRDFWTPSTARWTELARVADAAVVFADFDELEDGVQGTTSKIPLAPDAPMRREWAVVCDAPEHSACLSAWELPGQASTPDRHRIFEAVWTIDPRAVRDAARTCAQVGAQAGSTVAARLQLELADDPAPRVPSPAATTALFNRVIAYVDRFGA